MTLSEFIREAAKARGISGPFPLHRRLEEGGMRISHQAVHLWWEGKTRRLDDDRARSLIEALRLTDEEVTRLREVQSGLPSLPPEKDALSPEAA
jgi:hypothetical protein